MREAEQQAWQGCLLKALSAGMPVSDVYGQFICFISIEHAASALWHFSSPDVQSWLWAGMLNLSVIMWEETSQEHRPLLLMDPG